MAKKKLTLEDMLVPMDEIPYDVPENWCWVKLGSIAKFSQGIQVSVNNQFDELNEKRIRFIRIVDYTQSTNDIRYIEIPNKSRNCFVNKNDIVMVRYGCPGVVGRGIDGVIANNMFKIDVIDGLITKDYLFYYLKSSEVFNRLNKSGGSSTMPAINFKVVSDINIAIPPLAEQERIVKRIESLFDKVDRAAELVDEARDGFEKRRAAILERAFSGELTKKWREENGVSDEWKEKSLKDICKLTSGGTPSRKNENYYNGNIPWIKTGEIRWNEIYDSEEHITEEAIVNSSAKLIPENTVLVAMYGQGLTRGRAAILKKPSTTNQAVCALIPTNEITCEFLYYYFMKNYWKFREAAKGGNQENLSGKVIGNFSIQIPSLKEQIEIVNVLKKLLDKESNVEDITYIEENINIIKKSILAKAFRGELGSNDLNEESSIELLKELIK